MSYRKLKFCHKGQVHPKSGRAITPGPSKSTSSCARGRLHWCLGYALLAAGLESSSVSASEPPNYINLEPLYVSADDLQAASGSAGVVESASGSAGGVGSASRSASGVGSVSRSATAGGFFSESAGGCRFRSASEFRSTTHIGSASESAHDFERASESADESEPTDSGTLSKSVAIESDNVEHINGNTALNSSDSDFTCSKSWNNDPADAENKWWFSGKHASLFREMFSLPSQKCDKDNECTTDFNQKHQCHVFANQTFRTFEKKFSHGTSDWGGVYHTFRNRIERRQGIKDYKEELQKICRSGTPSLMKFALYPNWGDCSYFVNHSFLVETNGCDGQIKIWQCCISEFTAEWWAEDYFSAKSESEQTKSESKHTKSSESKHTNFKSSSSCSAGFCSKKDFHCSTSASVPVCNLVALHAYLDDRKKFRERDLFAIRKVIGGGRSFSVDDLIKGLEILTMNLKSAKKKKTIKAKANVNEPLIGKLDSESASKELQALMKLFEPLSDDVKGSIHLNVQRLERATVTVTNNDNHSEAESNFKSDEAEVDDDKVLIEGSHANSMLGDKLIRRSLRSRRILRIDVLWLIRCVALEPVIGGLFLFVWQNWILYAFLHGVLVRNLRCLREKSESWAILQLYFTRKDQECDVLIKISGHSAGVALVTLGILFSIRKIAGRMNFPLSRLVTLVGVGLFLIKSFFALDWAIIP